MGFLILAGHSPACLEAAAIPDPARLERQVLAVGLHDPVQMEPLPNGDVLIAEMGGVLKRWRVATGDLMVVGSVPVTVAAELGLIGVAVPNDFQKSGHVFLFYCPQGKRDVQRLARFTLDSQGRLELASEKVLLEYPIEFGGAIHMGGGLCFDKASGNLILGTGDNSPPIPEPPVDISPGGLLRDALRSSANSMDLRGKILRIHPLPDGSYGVPKGNLFSDPTLGRPEIFAMGVRNAFHSSVDPKTGWVVWGDVGPNTDGRTGSVGYDEFNLATQAGNFGHPMFTGPNEAYRSMGLDGKSGGFFDAAHPVNNSPRNTGIKELPSAQPALLWYPTTVSTQFPELGSGARSAMAGPFYHFDSSVHSDVKWPEYYDGGLFIYEWTRNWIKLVRLTPEGKLAGVEPFAQQLALRKPIDMKVAPDHTLLLLEYGDKWHGNTDGQLSRLIYRKGNRPPVAVLDASALAGKQPLEVRFDSSRSYDADGGPLAFAWDFGNGESSIERTPRFTFSEQGQYTVALKVSDDAGGVNEARTVITVGNSPPVVSIMSPLNGTFFNHGESVNFQVRVSDSEDGSSEAKQITPQRVVVQGAYRAARSGDAVHPGLEVMKRTTCFACHTVRDRSAGPAYLEVARKYVKESGAQQRLAVKVLAGGIGVWGAQVPMPPHPQHTLSEAQLMVDWILGLAHSPEPRTLAGLNGTLQTSSGGERQDGGVFILTASYNDNGAGAAPSLRGVAEHVLHARQRKAALYDASKGSEVVDFFEGGHGLVARLSDTGWVKFATVNLAGIRSLRIQLAPLTSLPVAIEVRVGSIEGALIANAETVDRVGEFREILLPVHDPGGLNDLVFIAKTHPARKGSVLDLNWILFSDK